ncbi:hypothetical protein Mapa_012165 [Marchantia paleacea]|nr:hypothetical protein Mapa_012165 [Marchantia paleacea]
MAPTNGSTDYISMAANLIFVVSLLLSTTKVVLGSADHEEQLHYDGPKGPQTWRGHCNIGKSQSPIDIVRHEAAVHQFPGLCKLHVEYNSETQATITHSGSHLLLKVEGDAPFGKLYLHDTYNLTGFHFHSPSEHKINSLSYDLELHLVHKTITQNGPQLAVIGLLYNQGPDNSSTNHFLQQVFDALPYIQKPDSSVHTFKSVDFSSLLPILDGPYARYSGSLTTPPCKENVTWTVLLNQNLKMSPGQFQAYKAGLKCKQQAASRSGGQNRGALLRVKVTLARSRASVDLDMKQFSIPQTYFNNKKRERTLCLNNIFSKVHSERKKIKCPSLVSFFVDTVKLLDI